MKRMNKQDLLKRDNFLVAILKNYKGLKNIISTKEIHEQLTEKGFNISLSSLNQVIKKLAFERNLPICSSNTKGYYWASCRADLEHTIADLQSRVKALQEHIEHLQQFFIY